MKSNNIIKKQVQKNGGYTLLFAVLVSSLVLAIGISILTISKKEFLLATSARDSSSALYAADSGVECAVYGDFPSSDRDAFTATSSDRTSLLGCNLPYNFTSKPIDLELGLPQTFVFHTRVSDTGACAVVQVYKEYITVDGIDNSIIKTTITSRGYNTGWDSSNLLCNKTSAKRVERAIELVY